MHELQSGGIDAAGYPGSIDVSRWLAFMFAGFPGHCASMSCSRPWAPERRCSAAASTTPVCFASWSRHWGLPIRIDRPGGRGAPAKEQCFHQERSCSGVSWLKPSTALATICRMGVARSSISAITRPRFSSQLGHEIGSYWAALSFKSSYGDEYGWC